LLFIRFIQQFSYVVPVKNMFENEYCSCHMIGLTLGDEVVKKIIFLNKVTLFLLKDQIPFVHLSATIINMQHSLDHSSYLSLIYLPMSCNKLFQFNINCRPRGIHGAFINGEGAQQNMTRAEIRAEQISGAFNNADYAKQNYTKAKIGRYLLNVFFFFFIS